MARSLFQILGPRGDELHAAMLAWLLDPQGEHGRGEELVIRLSATLDQRGIDWPGTGARLREVRTAQRVRGGVHEVALSHPTGGELTLILGAHLPGAYEALLAAQAAGERVVGCLLVPGAFPADAPRQLPVWTGQDLLKLLESSTGDDLYARVLGEYRDYLRLAIRKPRLTSERAPRVAPQSGELERPQGESSSPQAESSSGAAPPSARHATTAVRQRLGAAVAAFSEPEEWPDEVDLNLEAEILPSDDMSRAYVVEKMIGRGGQGYVFEVQIQGSQEFAGFKGPVERAVLKIAREGGVAALELEAGIYEQPDRGIVKLLDRGIANDSPYMVLEKLQPHPCQRFPQEPVHPAVAIDTFIHLLGVLQGIHMRRERPLLLFDIKPDNVMLRMGSASLEDDEYRRRLVTGAYEPVFMDMGCARDRLDVDRKQGRIGEFIGTPAYLPPESVPQLTGDLEGIYSVKTDVYSLTATLCQLLTGKRPYEHRGLWTLRGEAQLIELLAYKAERTDPFERRDLERSLAAFGPELTQDLLEVTRAGLHPEHGSRAPVAGLLNTCRRVFNVVERRKREVGEYYFDHVKGLRLWQTRIPRPQL